MTKTGRMAEKAAGVLFDLGWTAMDVARAIGVSASTAGRLRHWHENVECLVCRGPVLKGKCLGACHVETFIRETGVKGGNP